LIEAFGNDGLNGYQKQCERDFSSESDALTPENIILKDKKPESTGT
jgi:hypothetical protein